MADVTSDKLLAHLRSVRDAIPSVSDSVLFSQEKKIIRMNQLQLYDGKDIYGRDIRPYYTEDPYFKSPGQARAYMAWKQKLTPNGSRNPNAPNLFINGYFYSLMRLVKKGNAVVITAEQGGSLGIQVEQKYHHVLGLDEANQNTIDNELFNRLCELFQG